MAEKTPTYTIKSYKSLKAAVARALPRRDEHSRFKLVQRILAYDVTVLRPAHAPSKIKAQIKRIERAATLLRNELPDLGYDVWVELAVEDPPSKHEPMVMGTKVRIMNMHNELTRLALAAKRALNRVPSGRGRKVIRPEVRFVAALARSWHFCFGDWPRVSSNGEFAMFVNAVASEVQLTLPRYEYRTLREAIRLGREQHDANEILGYIDDACVFY